MKVKFLFCDLNSTDDSSLTTTLFLNITENLNLTSVISTTPALDIIASNKTISKLSINEKTTSLPQILPKNNVTNSTVSLLSINANLISNLTIKCLPNQELKTCGSLCPPTCALQDPICKVSKNCIKDVCQCKEGFVAHENGTCIHPKHCSKASIVKTCPPNSHLSPCGNLCAPTCQFPNPTICSLQCIVDDCICDKGFVLEDKSHKCIKPEECPKKKKICGQNETFQECGTKCEASCNQPFPGFCSDECLENVCQCSEGFLRDSLGKCVLASKCLL
uniref:TIL domain-containing protein n=1 Tax=Panagrolaimus sp. PS1159 TaxID=55785 RepID=A0AC35FZ60_9BILA